MRQETGRKNRYGIMQIMKTVTARMQLAVLRRTLVIFGLLSLLAGGAQLVIIMREMLNSNLSGDDVLISLLFAFLGQSGLLLTMSYFLCLLFYFTQLYAESEMYILFNLGVNENRILLWILPPTGLIAASVAALVFYLTPLSADLVAKMQVSQVQRQIQRLEDGDSYFDGATALSLRQGILRFMHIQDDGARIITGQHRIIAEPAAGLVQVRVHNGSWLFWQVDETVSGGEFKQADITLPPKQGPRPSIQATPTRELLGKGGAERAEFYQRLAIMLAVPITAPLALICSRRRPRQPRLGATFRGILGLFNLLSCVGPCRRSHSRRDEYPVVLGHPGRATGLIAAARAAATF